MASNGASISDEYGEYDDWVEIYFSRSVSGAVYDLNGKAVMQVSESAWADVHMLVPGIYLFRPESGTPQRFIVAGSM